MFYVYILKSLKNNSFYIGSTNNLERRITEHNAGKTRSLKYVRPLTLVFQQKCESLAEARKLELKLKKYKSRSIIEQIIKDQLISTTKGR